MTLSLYNLKDLSHSLPFSVDPRKIGRDENGDIIWPGGKLKLSGSRAAARATERPSEVHHKTSAKGEHASLNKPMDDEKSGSEEQDEDNLVDDGSTLAEAEEDSAQQWGDDDAVSETSEDDTIAEQQHEIFTAPDRSSQLYLLDDASLILGSGEVSPNNVDIAEHASLDEAPSVSSSVDLTLSANPPLASSLYTANAVSQPENIDNALVPSPSPTPNPEEEEQRPIQEDVVLLFSPPSDRFSTLAETSITTVPVLGLDRSSPIDLTEGKSATIGTDEERRISARVCEMAMVVIDTSSRAGGESLPLQQLPRHNPQPPDIRGRGPYGTIHSGYDEEGCYEVSRPGISRWSSGPPKRRKGPAHRELQLHPRMHYFIDLVPRGHPVYSRAWLQQNDRVKRVIQARTRRHLKHPDSIPPPRGSFIEKAVERFGPVWRPRPPRGYHMPLGKPSNLAAAPWEDKLPLLSTHAALPYPNAEQTFTPTISTYSLTPSCLSLPLVAPADTPLVTTPPLQPAGLPIPGVSDGCLSTPRALMPSCAQLPLLALLPNTPFVSSNAENLSPMDCSQDIIPFVPSALLQAMSLPALPVLLSLPMSTEATLMETCPDFILQPVIPPPLIRPVVPLAIPAPVSFASNQDSSNVPEQLFLPMDCAEDTMPIVEVVNPPVQLFCDRQQDAELVSAEEIVANNSGGQHHAVEEVSNKV